MFRFVDVDPASDAAIAAMTAYFAELDDRFPTGFDPGDTLVADAHTMRPPAGTFVIGTSENARPDDGDRHGDHHAEHVDAADVAACGGVLTIGTGIGEIKRMWVAPHARGRGLGRLLLAELESRCRALGHRTVRLDTNSVLAEAIAMYHAAGYQSINRYNDNPFAQRWFEKQLD